MENFYAVYKFNKYLPMNPPKKVSCSYNLQKVGRKSLDFDNILKTSYFC